MVNCRVDERDEQISFFADKIEPLDTKISAERLRIRLDAADALAGVHARLERANGRKDASHDAMIELLMPLRDGGEIEMRLPGRHSADAALQAALKGVKGVASIESA